RVVTVRFKPVSDAARLVDQLLGPCGAYRVPKALKLITIEDQPERLARIAEAIGSWDLPPRSVELTVSLIMARRDDGGADKGLVGEIRGVTETLSEVTSYTTFERVGTASVRAMEGGEASLELGGRYKVAFRVGGVDPERGIVQLQPFSLSRLPRPGEAASGLGTVPHRLLSMELDLPEGQMHLVGAPGRARDKALFLALTVWALDDAERSLLPDDLGAPLSPEE
ncbi:MAG: hypothetical protein OEQ13_14645, partial [Acidobacteriota bacterium]|nr:hypothetical protein [Acidobacteriota bacterium]